MGGDWCPAEARRCKRWALVGCTLCWRRPTRRSIMALVLELVVRRIARRRIARSLFLERGVAPMDGRKPDEVRGLRMPTQRRATAYPRTCCL